VAAMASRTRARVLFYGQSQQCHVRGSDVVSRGLDGITFRLTYGESSASVSCPPRTVWTGGVGCSFTRRRKTSGRA